MRIKIIEDLEE